ncbi:MAG: decaprenyl-phosphate phosphoribosyltransferase [Herpetosiphonaceae bacterium]|nr:decaprenyl-phosphate phosphoribosyltransferase [Herpetosiphonaceae bacterium]
MLLCVIRWYLEITFVNEPITLARSSLLTTLRYLLKAMRPKQWVKNAFVFAGIVFAEKHLFTNVAALGRVLIAFILFCLVSSSIYLINDLADIEQDRQHPRKRLRPLASGQLSPVLARLTAVALAFGSLLVPLTLIWTGGAFDRGWAAFTVVLVLYFVLQVAYTFVLKHVVIIDLFAIAGGFVLRAVGGAAVLFVAITPWWLLCVLLLALFLGLGKRYNELQVLESDAGSHRRILEEYSHKLLEQLILIDVACTIMAYSQATFTAPAVPKEGFPYLMLTIPFVIYAMFRYLYLIVQKKEGGEPADLLFRDRPFFTSIMSWGILVVAILVWFGNK